MHNDLKNEKRTARIDIPIIVNKPYNGPKDSWEGTWQKTLIIVHIFLQVSTYIQSYDNQWASMNCVLAVSITVL